MILDERDFSNFEEWAERAGSMLERYGPAPTIISYRDWQLWANAVCQFSLIAGQSPPSPSMYGAWRPWAKDFNQSINLPVV